ncbi:DNA-binding protein [Rheinheimera maricola]|uniref:DNA-binding protein n=1 Tax=Rheinheimera maricola TaxID=2793282 RepID=A0ABS7X6G8_9GAMM|nr:DNA-binding protein [Rheinheimera maricola]MBZ9610784.1 DNA-binding protein [Rheinheimera maricola]
MATTQPTSNQIKHNLRQQGFTVKSWAEAKGFSYRTVSDVLRGLRKGNFGEGRDVRQALGLPVEE